jgi:predicted PhzF superfamily epimerase YddE/YHI9
MELDFPALPPRPAEPPPGLLDALHCEALAVASSRFDFLVEVASEEVLENLRPDFVRLKSVQTRGVIVTCRGGAGRDFLSRFFCPAAGIDEDPVTGSAHCVLGPYWAARLGETALVGYQASRRGGTVRVRVEGDRVRLGGQAVTILRGELFA